MKTIYIAHFDTPEILKLKEEQESLKQMGFLSAFYQNLWKIEQLKIQEIFNTLTKVTYTNYDEWYKSVCLLKNYNGEFFNKNNGVFNFYDQDMVINSDEIEIYRIKKRNEIELHFSLERICRGKDFLHYINDYQFYEYFLITKNVFWNLKNN